MKSDLHVHTNYSYDGFSSPEAIVKAALRRNLDCIVITDHHTTKGAKEAFRAALEEPLLVIPGIEITSQSGHILGLDVKKNIPSGLSAQETIKRIKQQNGLAIIPHPFQFFIGFKRIFEILESMDGIEIFNAQIFKKSNQKALDLVYENNFSFTAGSDAHSSFFVGRAFVETVDFQNPQQLMERIKNKELEVGGENPHSFEKILMKSQLELQKTKNFFLKNQVRKHFDKKA